MYIIFISCFWWIFAKKRKKVSLNYIINIKFKFLNKLKPLLYILLVVPLIAVLLSPDPSYYLNYAGSAKGLLVDSNLKEYHSFLLVFCRITIISAGLLLIMTPPKQFLRTLILCLPFLLMVSWIYGKRSIVATILVLIIYVVWSKGFLKGFRFVGIGISVFLILMFFSILYQQNIRYDIFQIDTNEKVYENMRIDFGRDDVTKFTIYSELNKMNRNILEYRGQSFLYYLTAFIPRDLWEEKPYPYAVYFTTSIFNLPPIPLGWGITTSILEETISNFGWIGILIGPLIITLMCRLGDRKRDPLISLLTLYCTTLILVQHLAAFYSIFIFWLLLIIFKKKTVPEVIALK